MGDKNVLSYTIREKPINRGVPRTYTTTHIIRRTEQNLFGLVSQFGPPPPQELTSSQKESKHGLGTEEVDTECT